MENKQFNDILTTVPGSFKAKLERIRRYLHLDKASVMVGAGFSRNADVPPHIKVKQWDDVGEDIYCRLQAVEIAEPKELVFKTPMRLASEFAAVNGRNELDNLIRDAIPDDKMDPGGLHRQLLELPWRDVFTTNYDTLLERARGGLQRHYSVVSSKEMLLYKKSPRIIKLHGSFPDKTPFLMTEEDFMDYPKAHPEFVNTVRQALVESIFCLVGFSGDDPNFTSWQAWLQDVMGEYAGPSYLITCDKNYDEAFKVLMRQRGVEVVNLSEIKGLGDYKTALDFFFTYLSPREPEWSGRVEYDWRKVDLVELTERMKLVREGYPGWFVLPKRYYNDFSDMTYYFPMLDKKFQELDDKSKKEDLLYELDWRADKSLTFKDFDWYREALEAIVNGYGEDPLSDKAITLAISLLRLYRHHLDKQSDEEALINRIAKELTRMSQQQYNQYYYTVSCNALSVLDYDSVKRILDKWNPSPSHYTGIIYKALVMSESTGRTKPVEMLSEALERITLSLSQNTTQEELSLKIAIESLLAFYSGERMPDNDPKFSFLTLSDYFQRKISDRNREHFEITHGFGIGTSGRSWNHNNGINKDLLNPYRYLLFCEAYGFPYGMANSTVDEKILETVLPLLTVFGINYSIGPVLRSGSRKAATAYLNRKALNTLSREAADELAKLLLSHTSQKSCENAHDFRASNILSPILSRLASSCSSNVVLAIFKYVYATYRATYMAKREDMQIVFSCVMPEAIQAVYDDVFESEIYRSERDLDIPLPHNGYEYYNPSRKAVEVACKGLESSEKEIRQSAYCRIEQLLKANIEIEQKVILENAIIKWRATEDANLYTRDSFNEVPAVKEEKKLLEELVSRDVEKFLVGDYTYKNSSLEISSLDTSLRNITVEANSLNVEQSTAVLNKLAEVLKVNLESYVKDDSDEMLGGIRHFTEPVFKLVGELVRLITNNGYSEKKPCEKLFKVLQQYLPSGLPVRITMERLNNVARVMGANNIREIITKEIISDNEQMVIDSCNAFISYAHHYANYQTVLQDLIFYATHAVAEHLRLYIQTLMMIPLDKMSGNTQNQLAVMLKALLERIPKQNISEEEKVDIMHDGVALAASLKEATEPVVLVEAVKQWEEYANSEEVYNDIRRPWFLN